jgi:hypothetical protein
LAALDDDARAGDRIMFINAGCAMSYSGSMLALGVCGVAVFLADDLAVHNAFGMARDEGHTIQQAEG